MPTEVATGHLSMTGSAAVVTSMTMHASGSLRVAGYVVYSKTVVVTPTATTPIVLAAAATKRETRKPLVRVYSQTAAVNGWFTQRNTAYIAANTAAGMKQVKRTTVPGGLDPESGTVVID